MDYDQTTGANEVDWDGSWEGSEAVANVGIFVSIDQLSGLRLPVNAANGRPVIPDPHDQLLVEQFALENDISVTDAQHYLTHLRAMLGHGY
jgi:hypothetical protein